MGTRGTVGSYRPGGFGGYEHQQWDDDIEQRLDQLRVQEKRSERAAERFNYTSSGGEVSEADIASAMAATTGVAGTQQGFYNQIIKQAQQNASAGRAGLDAAQARREGLSQDYAAHEQNLTQFLSGLAEQENAKMSERQQELVAKTTRDLVRRGVSQEDAQQQAERGVGATFASAGRQVGDRQLREKLGLGVSMSAMTLGAEEAAIRNRANVIGSKMEMAAMPSSVIAHLTQVQETERTAIARSNLALAEAKVRSLFQGVGAAETRRQASLGYHLGMQKIAMGAQLDYKGLQSETDLHMKDATQSRNKIEFANKLKIAGLPTSGVPNPTDWASQTPGGFGAQSASALYAAPATGSGAGPVTAMPAANSL